jgi:glycosyltransferase involved in cell wall biosynthesis
MKVALMHHYSLTYGGGGERFITELATYLSSRGHAVEVHALPWGRKGARVDLPEQVLYCERSIHRVKADVAYYVYAPLIPHLFLCSAPKVAGLHAPVVAEELPSAVDSFRQGPHVFGAYLARKFGLPRQLRMFDAVHVVMKGRVAHPNVFLLPNWVDCSHREAALRQRQRRPSKFTVLYVGKRSYIKGYDRFVEVSRLNDEEDIEFIATVPPGRGDGDGRVRCLGMVPHDRIWDLFATAGVLVHPTLRETFGRVIIEALASGAPVITTRIPGHTGLGLSLDYASSVEEIAAKIHSLYDEWANDYPAYLARSRRLAEEVAKYDAAFLLPQYEAMLAGVANGFPNGRGHLERRGTRADTTIQKI